MRNYVNRCSYKIVIELFDLLVNYGYEGCVLFLHKMNGKLMLREPDKLSRVVLLQSLEIAYSRRRINGPCGHQTVQ
jgi:hypothetical protein